MQIYRPVLKDRGLLFHTFIIMFCNVLSIGGRIDRKVWSVLTLIKSFPDSAYRRLICFIRHITIYYHLRYCILILFCYCPAKIILLEWCPSPLLMDQILEEIIRVELSMLIVSCPRLDIWQ